MSKEREPKLSPAERRRRQESNRRQDKDRTAHDAARGVKAPALSDLSKHKLTDLNARDIIAELNGQTDRGAALIAASLVDVALAAVLKVRLVGFPDLGDMFESDNGPLSTFSNRTRIARAIGVIGEVPERRLNAIRRIRNQFAHSAYPIDFKNTAIAEEIKQLEADRYPDKKPEWSTERRRYVGTCISLYSALINVGVQHQGDEITIWLS